MDNTAVKELAKAEVLKRLLLLLKSKFLYIHRQFLA